MWDPFTQRPHLVWERAELPSSENTVKPGLRYSASSGRYASGRSSICTIATCTREKRGPLAPAGSLVALRVSPRGLEQENLVSFKSSTVCLAAARLLKQRTPETLSSDKCAEKAQQTNKKRPPNTIKEGKSCAPNF